MKLLILSLLHTAFTQNIELAAPISDFTTDLENSLSDSSTNQDAAGTIAKALKSLNPDNNFGDICNKKLITLSPENLYSAYSAHKLAAAAGCQQTITVDTEKILKYAKTEKKSGDNLNVPNLFYAIHILRRSKSLGNLDNRNNILDNLNTYEKSSKSLVDAAFTMLAGIEAGGAKLTKFVTLKNRVDLAGKILSSGVQYDFNRLVLEDGNFEVSSLAVRALVATNKALSNSKNQNSDALLSGEDLIQLANAFLLSKPVTSLEKAYVVQALSALNAEMTGLAKPVSVKKTLNYPNLEFYMTDVFGKAVTSSRFSVKIGDQIEDVDSSGKIDMDVFGLSSGVHNYELSVSGGSNAYAGAKSGETFKILVPSTEKLDLAKVSMKIKKKGKTDTKDAEEIGSRSMTLGDTLGISFQVSGKPHQVMVRFSKDDVEGFVLMRSIDEMPGFYAAPVEIDTTAKSIFKGKSGVWNVEAILGDVSAHAIIQNLGSVEISLPADMEIENNVYSHFEPMKTISHTFPEPESRPPAAISSMFMMITLAPLAVLVILWGIIGFNFKLFSVSIWGLFFHVSMGAVFGLYVCYWIGYVNMFLTIRYLSMIGVVLMVSGNKHLNNIAIARKAVDNDKGKKDK